MKLDNWLKWKFAPPLIVLINGKARHGKDTFGAELRKVLGSYGYSTERLSFGDEVKKVAERKDRDYLQAIGQAGRTLIDKDIWIERTIDNYSGSDVVVITDARYPNEINYFEDKPNISVRVERMTEDREKYESELTEEQKSHSSETSLDNFEFDMVCRAVDVDELRKQAVQLARECNRKIKQQGGITIFE